MKSALRVIFALVVVLAGSSVASAQEAASAPNIGIGLGMGLSILGAGLGLGLIGFAALSGIARQPEQAKTISSTMILMAALVEGAAIISLVLCLLQVFIK